MILILCKNYDYKKIELQNYFVVLYILIANQK